MTKHQTQYGRGTVGRPRLSKESVTVTKKYKTPKHEAKDFTAECKEAGLEESETIRILIKKWMMKRAEIKRMKEKT